MKAKFIKAPKGSLIGFPLPAPSSPFVTGKNPNWAEEVAEYPGKVTIKKRKLND